jgi:hypothetical protein
MTMVGTSTTPGNGTARTLQLAILVALLVALVVVTVVLI